MLCPCARVSILQSLLSKENGSRESLWNRREMAPWPWIICLSLLALASPSQCVSVAEKLTEAAHASNDQDEDSVSKKLPLVISTWAFVEAVKTAWKVVQQNGSSLDAVVEGCSTCEMLRCDLSALLTCENFRVRNRSGLTLSLHTLAQNEVIREIITQYFGTFVGLQRSWIRWQSRRSWGDNARCNGHGWKIVVFNVVHYDQPYEEITITESSYNSQGKISFVLNMPNAVFSFTSRDGQTTMDVGAVGALRKVKDAIRAARLVLDHSEHTLLVGDQASAFALSLGIPGPSNLSTEDSLQQWSTWRDVDCQPNFRKNVVPHPRLSCGPYHVPACDAGIQFKRDSSDADLYLVKPREREVFGIANHDTISMAVIDKGRKIAVGTSTNGASHKIPGRVGDGPIAGAAAYADDDVGACGATGDGDIMMRFAPCYQVVESMRRGKSPKHAAQDAIKRIKRKYPKFVGAVFAVNRNGKHAGACNGWTFQYAVRGNDGDNVEIHTVNPFPDDS